MMDRLPDIEPTLAATDPAAMQEYNKLLVEQFRSNDGQITGQLAGAPVLLLNTTGARSGRACTTPLAYVPDGGTFVIMASKAGSPRNPDWYHNLLATPTPTIEVGDRTMEVKFTVVAGAERSRLFELVASYWPMMNDYERNTEREIPLIVLEADS